jgi:hypothetical protein
MNQKKYLSAILIFILILCSSNYAQKLSVGAGGFYILKNQTIDNVFGYQANLMVKTQQRIAMLASIGHFQESAADIQFAYAVPFSFKDLTTGGNYLLDGEFSQTYLELSPIIDLFEIKSPKARFCIGGGLGLYYARNKWDENTYRSLFMMEAEDSLFYHEDEISPHLGFNFRAALNIPATPRSFFSVEAKYVYYKPGIRYEIHTPELSAEYIRNREIDLSTLSINIFLMLIL